MRLLAVFMLLTFPIWVSTSAHACGALDLACKANRTIDNWISARSGTAGAAAASAAAQQIRPLLDRVLAEQMPALIRQAEGAVRDQIITAEQAGQRLMLQIDRMLNSTLDKALENANQIVGNVRAEIVEKLVTSLNDVATDFIKELDRLAQQNWYEANCLAVRVDSMARDQQTYFFDQFNAIIDRLPFGARTTARDQCHKINEIAPKERSQYNPVELYLLWQCAVISTQTPTTPARTIAAGYMDMEARTANMICVMRQAPETRQFFLRERLWASERASIWNRASANP